MNETLRWLESRLVKPDDAQSVLVAMPNSESEPVWVGWYDSSTNEWRCASSANVIRETVSHWTPMPQGPL